MTDIVPTKYCISCSETQNLTRHSTYQRKDGTTISRYLCRKHNLARVHKRRGKNTTPITIETPKRVYNPFIGRIVEQEV